MTEALASKVDENAAAPTVNDIYQQLRAEILHGKLAAGSVISQVKLAERLGVNRTPLREALRMLQREDLVQAELNRRVQITELTSADLVQLYSLRIVQESLAIRLTVPQLTPEDLAELEELLRRMDALGAPATFDEWERHHGAFHRLLVSRAGGRICRTVGDLGDYCERYRRALLQMSPVGFDIGATEHTRIVAACREDDPDAAAVALARHLGRTALTLLSVTDPAYDPVAVRQALRQVIGDSPPPTPLVPDPTPR